MFARSKNIYKKNFPKKEQGWKLFFQNCVFKRSKSLGRPNKYQQFFNFIFLGRKKTFKRYVKDDRGSKMFSVFRFYFSEEQVHFCHLCKQHVSLPLCCSLSLQSSHGRAYPKLPGDLSVPSLRRKWDVPLFPQQHCHNSTHRQVRRAKSLRSLLRRSTLSSVNIQNKTKHAF